MATGIVKWYNGQKGYGFIQPDEGGADVFVHISAVQRSGLNGLDEGQRIQYEIVKDKRTGKSAADTLSTLEGIESTPQPEPVLVDQIKPVEQQRNIARTFVVGTSGAFVVDERQGNARLLGDSDAVMRHAEAVRLLTTLLSLCEETTRGSNETKFVYDDALLLQQALGNAITEVLPGALIPRNEVMRQTEAAQLRLRSNVKSEADSDIPRLPEKLFVALCNSVSACNHFIQLDPELVARDQALLGPDEFVVAIGTADGLAFVSKAIKAGVADKSVLSAAEEEARVAPAIGDSANRNSRRFSEFVRNLLRAALAKSLAFAKIATKAATWASAAAGLGYGCAVWVVANESWLVAKVAGDANLVRSIQDIVAFLRTLPIS